MENRAEKQVKWDDYRMTCVLVVDDNSSISNKGMLTLLGNMSDVTVEVRATVNCALKFIKNNHVDILVTDIQLPRIIGGDIDSEGGCYLLESMLQRVSRFGLPSHVLGISAHQESISSCYDFFVKAGWPLINKNEEAVLVSIVRSYITQISSRKNNTTVDVAVITALSHIELESILELDFGWQQLRLPDDSHCYNLGSFSDRDGEVRSILAVSCTIMGSVSSAVTTSLVNATFNPRLVVMTGIAAGMKGKNELGDILVADTVWDWGAGKRTVANNVSKLLPSPHQIQIDPSLRSDLIEASKNREFLDEIYKNWKQGNKPPTILSMHVGPIVSGASVLEDPAIVEEIKMQHRGVIGIEMESYGVLFSCSLSKNKPRFLIVKSVCDFADVDKNDDYQKYAAFTSAEFAKHYITKQYDFIED